MSDVIDTIPDYKLAAKEIHLAYQRSGLCATVTGGSAIVTDGDKWQHRAFNVNFVNARSGHFANFTWRQGTGVKGDPIPAEVLAGVCREFADSETTFEDWADNFGYDKDSRRAEKLFNECRAIGANLLHLGLTRKQIQAFAKLSARL